MPRSNRNFPDDPTPPWQERDKALMHAPISTDGGSVDTPPTAGEQVIPRSKATAMKWAAGTERQITGKDPAMVGVMAG